MAHVEEPGAQTIDALNFSWPALPKNIVLDDFELFGDLVDDREVIVSDKIKNSIYDGAFTRRSSSVSARNAAVSVRYRRAMADRDDKPLPTIRWGLAVFNFLPEVGSSQHDEEDVVDVQFGALVPDLRPRSSVHEGRAAS